MVPLVSSANVGGVPVTDMLGNDAVERIVERTRKAGAEVVALLKTGSAFISPAASVTEMVKAVLLDERRVLPAAVRLAGEYGYDGVTLGVPVRIGAGGMLGVVEVTLSDEERAALDRSAEAVREGIAALE
jgi:malate dehydrogenase